MDTADKTNRFPRWLEDINRLLPIRAQFVLSGNIRDRFLTPLQDGYSLTSFLPCLWSVLQSKGFRFIMVYDRVDGIKVYPDTPDIQKQAKEWLEITLTDGAMPADYRTLLGKLRRVVTFREARIAAVIDYASRLPSSPQALSDDEKMLFVGCEKLAQTATPVMPKEAAGGPLYNPVIWLLNRAQDLPSWFTLDSEKIHPLEIAKPDYEQRFAAARLLTGRFSGAETAGEEQREKAVITFTEATDGLTLQALSDISQLAVQQQIPLHDIDDAIRCFKVGALDNPWKKDYLRGKIRNARDSIEARVKGQHQAVVKTIDILTRSVMGLTGAQARSAASRPRGVLFFAGPTGVGKTELAKALTQLMFGDERAYIRFDMSEFAEEHASARLLGAPPGYVGYDAGGELTNAVRQRPFSVILFDEIEKAHPRLLDKFLQILEDGRLTDGRGETIYFSESVIIFTSNLGIYVTDSDGKRVQQVTPDDPYETVESRVRGAIGDYFKFSLSRPEILNRIGDNIVVFNFIRSGVAAAIFDGMLANIARRIRDEHKLELIIPDNVRAQLLHWCTTDLGNGGRGIGNRLETAFINPLARALFAADLDGKDTISIASVSEADNVYTVTLA